MLKKLRRKFIAIAMLSVSIVLIVIVGTINIANYISTNEALDARLKLIAVNGGTFPDLLEKKTQTHSAIQQMKVQIKGLPRSKSHHPAEQMYSHRRI